MNIPKLDDPEQHYIFWERIGMICEDGEITEQALQTAWEQVNGKNA